MMQRFGFNTWLAVGVAVGLLAGPGMTRAGGFMIGEMAARSAGMGTAFTAVADDASAAWHNPAGVAFMQGVQAMIGGDVIIVPPIDYASNAATKKAGGVPVTTAFSSKSKTLFVPHAYATWTDPDSRFGTAISVNSPFGLETDWPDNTTNPFAGKTTFSRMQMVMVNPSIIYRVTDNIAISGGASYANLYQVDLNSSLQNLSGSGDGWGGTAALMFRNDTFRFGVTYRSRIKVSVDGTAVAKGNLAALGGTTSLATTSVTLPDQVNVGLAWMPDEAWLLSLDVDWVNWKTYDALDIQYGSAAYRQAVKNLQTALGVPATGSTHKPRNWKATVAFRVGGEWRYAPNMRARFGYVFDPTPINVTYFDPSVPGNDRHLFSVGYGYDFSERTSLDLAYIFVYFQKRDQVASPVAPIKAPESVKNGSYKATVHIISASMSWRF